MSSVSKFRDYMKLVGNLKRVKRTGWVMRDVQHSESVAEHMYRMAMMAFAIPPDSGLDRDKCMKIALVHDMAETIVGDLTPGDNVPKSEKHKMEREATQKICNLFDDEVGQEMYSLWQEYESQTSPEARFVKDIDKLEMCHQAWEYEQEENAPGRLQEFFDFSKKSRPEFATEFVKEWRKDLYEQRDLWMEDGNIEGKSRFNLAAGTKRSSSSDPRLEDSNTYACSNNSASCDVTATKLPSSSCKPGLSRAASDTLTHSLSSASQPRKRRTGSGSDTANNPHST